MMRTCASAPLRCGERRVAPQVRVLGVSVFGSRLGVPTSVYTAHDAIVDSGTADLVLPGWAHLILKARMGAACFAGTPLVGVCADLIDDDR